MIQWIKMREEHLETVRNWRMRPDITHGMYTDPVITKEDQERWFQKVSKDPSQLYWITYKEDKPVGLVSLTEIDYKHLCCKTGGYVAEDRDFATVIANEYGILKVAFDELHLNRVEADVLSNNMRIVKMHEMEGYTTEGVLRQAICKNGQFYDIYIQSMLREEWLDGKMRYKTEIKIEL